MPTIEVEQLRPGAILESPAALDALRWIAKELRRLGIGERTRSDDEAWRGPLGQIASGIAVKRDEVRAVVPDQVIDGLLSAGAWVPYDDLLLPGLALAFAGGVPVAAPVHQRNDADMVYIGCEAPWLVRLAWRHGCGHGAAADLATGTGVVAVALSARYDVVVAADVLPAAVEYAELTLALNETAGRSTRAVVADVASGLPPEAFDLVTSNPPWVPTDARHDHNFVYGDGGPTGMELPRRFVRETYGLLCPGGTGVVIVLDTTWDDGSRPLERELDWLAARGCAVTLEPAPEPVWGAVDRAACIDSYPGCRSAELVGLVFTRPL